MTEISNHLKGQFIRLYQMAAADGDFNSEELKMLYAYAVERGVPKGELMRILMDPVGKIEIPQDLDTKIQYLYDLGKMVLADGRVDDDEIATMQKYAKRFDFKSENEEGIVAYILESVENNKSIYDVLKEIHNS